jgi:hypothetical protein
LPWSQRLRVHNLGKHLAAVSVEFAAADGLHDLDRALERHHGRRLNGAFDVCHELLHALRVTQAIPDLDVCKLQRGEDGRIDSHRALATKCSCAYKEKKTGGSASLEMGDKVTLDRCGWQVVHSDCLQGKTNPPTISLRACFGRGAD